jgi:hypothetical protein
MVGRPCGVPAQEHQHGTALLPWYEHKAEAHMRAHALSWLILCAGPATGYCTHDPPCLAPGALYQGNLRLWGAARIIGYLQRGNLCYMGPANQWDDEQQWMFDRVIETLLVHH